MIYPIKKNLKKITYKIKNKKFIARKKKCEVCDSDDSLLFHNCGKIGNRPGKYGYLPIRICKICSLKFISPRPTDNFYKKFFKLDYGASYFKGNYRPSIIHSKFQLIRGKLVYDYFKKFIKKKSKILDHGCSTGLTMMEWRKNGYDINGIDPHRPAVYHGIKKYNFKIDLSFGEKLPYEKNSYNTVISLGSLEHCFDLNKSLKEIHRILKLNGILIIRWRSDKLIGSPLEYFNYNTLKFFNKSAWSYVLSKNNFFVKKFIKSKVERYDSFEYIIAVKKEKVKTIRVKNAYNTQIKNFKKYIKKYKRLCINISNKNLYKKNFIKKKEFVKKNKIGLMNIGKKKSIERFFNETKYFLKFLNYFKDSEIKYTLN